ncbi:MAG: hypothetical protein KJT03_00865 [Verrucomicrobiae bacterium]|nr:hypothetical protein [Verrucomicrobiae bacterium]
MKISLKKAKAKESSPWHQDFRNPETLPDIKVIRTQFFVNFVAIVIPLFVATMWVQKEVLLGSLRSDIAKLEEKKDAMQSSNSNAVGLSRDFVKESAKIESLDSYYYNLFPVSEYLAALSEHITDEMVLTSVDVKKGNRIDGNDVVEIWQSNVSGYVEHGNTGAITAVNKLVEDISKDELLVPVLDHAFLDNLSRDQNTDTLNFVVSITMSDTKKDGGDAE